MIRVEREQLDEAGHEIKPNDAWFARANSARATALADGPPHTANPSIYAHNEVRMALIKLFNEKCAYCETKLTGFDWPVEHHRPKGAVRESPTHSGYFWLAYDWANLYPSCTHCNEHRNEKPRWGDAEPLGSGGKSTQFPLFNENERATSDDGIAAERPLLLDPCDSSKNPEDHLSYDPLGHVRPYRGSRRGKATIEICFLHRKELRDARKLVIGKMIRRLEMLRRARSKKDAIAIRDIQTLVAELTESGICFSGAARDVSRAPRRYGVR